MNMNASNGIHLFEFSDGIKNNCNLEQLDLTIKKESETPYNLKNQNQQVQTKPNLNVKKAIKKINAESIKCDICDLVLNSKVVYEQHLTGQKHLKKASSLNNPVQETTNNNKTDLRIPKEQNQKLKCEICNVESMSKLSYMQHIQGKKHLKKANGIQTEQNADDKVKLECFKAEIDNLQKQTSSSNQEEKKPIIVASKQLKQIETFRCDVCSLNLTTKDQYQIHLAGKKHLKKLSTISSSVSITKPQQNNKDDEFAHLNIAWDKYKMTEGQKKENGNNFEFYCLLCNKYMQRKMQLVDHLKSKKHHRKIYEKRMKENNQIPTSAQNILNKVSKRQIKFVQSAKPSITIQQLRKSYLSNKANQKFINNNNMSNINANKNVATNNNYSNNYYTSSNSVNLNAAFEQPSVQNVMTYPLINYYSQQQDQSQQLMQTSYSSEPTQYVQTNKRKSPGLHNNENELLGFSSYQKYRKANDSQSVGENQSVGSSSWITNPQSLMQSADLNATQTQNLAYNMYANTNFVSYATQSFSQLSNNFLNQNAPDYSK